MHHIHQSHDTLRSWQCQRNDVNHHKDFVLPMFIGNDDDACEPIESMPDVNRYGSNAAMDYLEPLVHEYGLRAVLLFPVIIKSDREKLDNETNDSETTNDLDDHHEPDYTLSSSPPLSSSSSSSSLASSSTSSSEASSRLENLNPLRRYSMSRRISDQNPPGRLFRNEEEEDNGSDHDLHLNAALKPQNPFLNQMNEEEEDHLLGNELLVTTTTATTTTTTTTNTNTNTTKDVEIKSETQKLTSLPPPPPPRNQKTLRKRIRELDIKLIKSMALKEKYNPVLRLIPKLRAKFPELLIICDVCLCAFTSTGHCCIFEEEEEGVGEDDHKDNHNHDHNDIVKNGIENNVTSASKNLFYNHHLAGTSYRKPAPCQTISNKMTCQYLAMLSVELAQKGCNVVAPSDMMDGRILMIRERLIENKLNHVCIMSYSAKFASVFYGPYRQATDTAPGFDDRRAYHLPAGSRAMAMKSVERDLKQGADFVLVKPGFAYLDIVRDIRIRYSDVPIAVYQVSGEYSMLKLAAKANLIDLKLAVNEVLTGFRRAGATIIISYFTPELLRGEL